MASNSIGDLIVSSVLPTNGSFSIRFFDQLTNKHDKNVFFSPYSIVTAMSLCLAGARNNTEVQLKKLFNFTNLSNEQIHKMNQELHKDLKSLGGSVSLNIANKIYQSNSNKVKQEYLDILKTYYETTSQGLDFSNASASAKIINDWVSGQTNNKIQNLVPETSIDKLTKLILVNAVYFKGNWEISFDKNQTFDDLFISSDKAEKMVKMMNLNGKHFNYVHEPNNLKLSALTIPYSGGKMAMTIILPHHDQKLSEIQSKLDEHILKSIFSTQNKIKINLILPKFKFEQEFELSKSLSDLGAPDAFGNQADFTGIDNNLFISKVIHKAIVDVNEEGTEAAAATAVVMRTKSMAIERVPEFRCNRPFIFFIHDHKNQSILFMGRYSKPE